MRATQSNMVLSSRDREFLLERLDPQPSIRAKLEAGDSLTEGEAVELRDLVAERLQTHGFDWNYKLTAEGRELERLFDVLFSG